MKVGQLDSYFPKTKEEKTAYAEGFNACLNHFREPLITNATDTDMRPEKYVSMVESTYNRAASMGWRLYDDVKARQYKD